MERLLVRVNRGWWLGACLLVLSLAACGGGGGGGGGNSETFSVGSEGGTISFTPTESSGGGVELDIPAGAVPDGTEITVSLATSFPASEDLAPGTVFQFEPDGLTFSTPATLTLAYDEAALGEIDENDLATHKVVAGAWEGVEGSAVDATADTVSVAMPGFSIWGLLRRFRDQTAPTVTGVNPPNGATLGEGQPIVVTFSEAMVPASLALGGTMEAESDGGAWSQTATANDTLIISPDSAWSTGAQTLTVDATDAAFFANPLATLSLTYTVDAEIPTAEALPASGATIHSLVQFTISFSESMDPATLVVGGDLAAEDDGGTWSSDGGLANDTLTISPAAAWGPGNGRSLTIDAGDLAGNAVATVTLAYTIGDAVFVSVDDENATDAGTGTQGAPFASITAAVTYADANYTVAEVRVAAGTYSVTSGTDHVVLAEGVSLYGGYATDWSAREPETYPTAIEDQSSSGGSSVAPNRAVEAGSGITEATLVDGFSITGGGGIISSGIFVSSGAAPLLTNNTISGGTGTTGSNGISNHASSPTIQKNTLTGGNSGNSAAGIFNQASAAPEISDNTIDGGSASNSSYGIYNSSASPLIENNAINGGTGTTNSMAIFNFSSAPIIRFNNISAGTESLFGYGIFNQASAPEIENNPQIDGGTGTGGSYGIYNLLASDPLISGNTIFGGDGSPSSHGIWNSGSSPEIMENNINGGTGTNNSYGIFNTASATPQIRENTISGGGSSGGISYGVYSADSASPTVERNTINGGEGNTSNGVYNFGATSPSIQNNVISGGDGGANSYGIWNTTSSAVVRNNTVDGGNGPSNSWGIVVNATSAPVVENNIVFTSAGTTRYCVRESTSTGDPASFANNDLFGCPTGLYVDNDSGVTMQGLDGDGNLTQNADGSGTALSTPTAADNVSADPVFEDQVGGDWHLTGSSPAGVTAGGLNGVDEGWGFSDDKDGVTRPGTGNPWAMGAYQP